MKCACDQCKKTVSSEGELCAFCAGRCFPVVGGKITAASVEHRVKMHAVEAPPPIPPSSPTTSDPSPVMDVLKRAGKAFLKEAEKELIPSLVKLGEREVKRRIGGG